MRVFKLNSHDGKVGGPDLRLRQSEAGSRRLLNVWLDESHGVKREDKVSSDE